MTGVNDDVLPDEEHTPSQPWHNSTPALLGASIAGLLAIAIVIALVTVVTRQFDTPQQAPLNFVEPGFSAPATSRPPMTPMTPTTTATITSTSPPLTTDINTSETPTSAETSSGTSTSSTPSTSPTSSPAPSSTSRANDTQSSSPGTTRRPRYNETRTLYPLPRN